MSRPPAPALTLGVEEEYLLVDRETRDLVPEAPDGLLEACQAKLGGQVSVELLQTQIEVQTRVCGDVAEVRDELTRLRASVAEVANDHGLGVIAASTHPFGSWHRQRHTLKPRYHKIDQDYQAVARRMVICGMHIHVGIDDNDLRIELLNQFARFLPLLLSLSASSPFWEGEDTGLKSYRLTVLDALPRTGLPPSFASWHDFDALVRRLVKAGSIEDGTKIWWDLRPSARFPTLEMRVTDICTRLDDTLAIVALTQCLFAMLWQLRLDDRQLRACPAALIDDNRWRAMRYGVDARLIDYDLGEVTPVGDIASALVRQLRPHARSLGCEDALAGLDTIARDGSSANRQLAIRELALRDGAEPAEADRAVVDMLLHETLLGAGLSG